MNPDQSDLEILLTAARNAGALDASVDLPENGTADPIRIRVTFPPVQQEIRMDAEERRLLDESVTRALTGERSANDPRDFILYPHDKEATVGPGEILLTRKGVAGLTEVLADVVGFVRERREPDPNLTSWLAVLKMLGKS